MRAGIVLVAIVTCLGKLAFAQSVDAERERSRDRFCDLSRQEVHLSVSGMNVLLQARAQLFAEMMSQASASNAEARHLEDRRRQWERLNGSVETSLRTLAEWLSVRSNLSCQPL